MAQCDNQDGVQDKIVMSPDKCKFDFGSLSFDSPNANKTSCFSHAQLSTLHKMTDSWNAPDGTKLFPGFPPGADPSILTLQANPSDYGFLQWFVYNDTSWNYSTFSYADVQATDRINPGQATANHFDLSAFKHRGGKLIMYHGWLTPSFRQAHQITSTSNSNTP
jgi:feruloyl esterase